MGTSKGTRRSLQETPGRIYISWVLATTLLIVGSVYGAATPAEEAQALEVVLTSMGYQFYDASKPACTWNVDIVECNPTSGLITALNLSSMNLTGRLPPEIGKFSSLELLDLSRYNDSLGPPNSVKGPLPDEFGNLSQLKYLNLSFVMILSNFPPCILRLTKLIDLRLDNANMTGTIPPQINRLKNLENLFLGNNNMKGPFPATLGDLSKLQQLTVWGNAFKDRIPDSLGKLKNLTYLNFHTCFMWGPLPASFGNLRNMQKLWLYNNELTGGVPDSWQNLQSVSDLNIRQNFLSGTAPRFLNQLPKLKRLDVSQNKFTGPVPSNLNTSRTFLESWTNKLVQNCDMSCNYFNGSFPLEIAANINITGNCFDNSTKQSDFCKRDIRCDMMGEKYDKNGCVPCPSSQKIYDPAHCLCGPEGAFDNKKAPIGAIVGGAIGGVAFVLIILALWHFRTIDFADPFQRKKIDYGPWEPPQGVQRYMFKELTKATNNWSESNELGQGGFGKVFHGIFDDGKQVAIKRGSEHSVQGTLEFRNEVLLLSRLHHRHLVRLEGFCDERGLQILVYEYMENGNLHDLLMGVKKGKDLNYVKRLEIAVGVAQGLDYLHSFADPPVIHRDIKPSNILLDSELIAKVADFGISKESLDLETHISTRPAGTAGYLDPEYFLRRQLTTASDVYAFGVCLMELITGQQSIDHMRLEEYNLIEWVKPRFKVGGVDDVVDVALGEDYDKEVLKLMVEVALACTAVSKNDRPTMKDVLNVLGPHVSTTLSLDAASIASKARALSMSEEPKALYTGKKRYSNSIDHTSSSTPPDTQFNIQILTPR